MQIILTKERPALNDIYHDLDCDIPAFATVYLVGGPKYDVELERRLCVCDGGSIALPQFRDRRPLAKQPCEKNNRMKAVRTVCKMGGISTGVRIIPGTWD